MIPDPQSHDSTQDQSLDAVQMGIEDIISKLNSEVRKGQIPLPVMQEVLRHALENGRIQAQLQERTAQQTSRRDLAALYWEEARRNKASATTGLASLNDALGGGLEAQTLLVLLGAPGSGKTTLANQIAEHVAGSGRPVLYVTSEDRPFKLFAKTISARATIPYTAVLKGWRDYEDRINTAIADYLETVNADRLHTLDATDGVPLDEIAERAKKHFDHYPVEQGGGPGLLVIDYIQRLARAHRRATGRDLREAVTDLTEHLRSVATSVGCTVLALASMNRASGYNSANNALASAKESGDIEYTADVVMTIGEDNNKNRRVHVGRPWVLRIDKNRLGENDLSIALDWISEYQRFVESEK